ncbi:MAG: flagellar biosynthetic protein FliO [Myxococcales bacterium]|nr:flagellar biosynthetic protein FliO [Myxococcales bacterium]
MFPGLVLADASWSGPSAPVASSSAATPGVDPGLGVSLLGPLALVSVLLIAVLLLLRYLRLAKARSSAGLLSVIEQATLSPQHTVYLVHAAGRYLLLGAAPGGLSLLTEVPTSHVLSQQPPGVLTSQSNPDRFVSDGDDSEEDLPAIAARPTSIPSLPAEPLSR